MSIQPVRNQFNFASEQLTSKFSKQENLKRKLKSLAIGKYNLPDGTTRATIFVTPVLAKEILETFPTMDEDGNRKNRRPKPTVLKRYISDMRRGNWSRCCEPAAISNTNFLIASQHRFLAQVETNTSHECEFIFDAPEDYARGLAGGSKQSHADQLGVTPAIVAAANTIFHLENYRELGVQPTLDNVSDICERFDMESVAAIFDKRPYKVGAIMAAFVIAISGKPERADDILQLAEGLKKRHTTTYGAASLARFIDSKKPIRQATDSCALCLRILRGIKAHLLNENIDVLYVTRVGLDYFRPDFKFDLEQLNPDQRRV